jgi:glycosyltransferase involved in cell wall biosynthesis
VAELRVISDVFVFPSLWEGMPNVMVDAMASGMAMIVAPVGGIPEVVKDGESALFVKPTDAQSLADAILGLKNNETLRKMVGENARKAVRREDLTWEHHIRKVIELF